MSSLDREGRFRVHRIADGNGDRDALDSEELTRLVDEQPGFTDDPRRRSRPV